MTNVLTWAADPAADGALAVSERLRALQRSHHAMWNYVTYRDAIALVGEDADALYPEGTTRLPADWADLGWLTCFCGPPASAVEAMRAAVQPRAPDMSAPDPIEPPRARPDRAAARRGRRRARPAARRGLRGDRRRGRPGRARPLAAGDGRPRRRGDPRRPGLPPPAARRPRGGRPPGPGRARGRHRLPPRPRPRRR